MYRAPAGRYIQFRASAPSLACLAKRSASMGSKWRTSLIVQYSSIMMSLRAFQSVYFDVYSHLSFQFTRQTMNGQSPIDGVKLIRSYIRFFLLTV